MNTKAEKWLQRIFGNEGGYWDDPVGGPTKWGISQRSYPHLDIPSLTLEQAGDIYVRDFLTPLLVRPIQDGITYQLFDFAAHSGIGTAIRQIQKTLGIGQDGIVGSVTQQAILNTSDSDLVMRINARRIRYMKSLKNWEENHNGWIERIATNLDYGAEDTD